MSTSASNGSLFTDVCVTLVTYHHDVKLGSSVVWPFQDLRQAEEIIIIRKYIAFYARVFIDINEIN